MRRARLLFLALPAVALAVACSSGSGGTTACRYGADCASGVCRSDGTCAPDDPPPPGDAGTTPSDDAQASKDAGPLPGCVPNRDGQITAAEVPLRAGLKATFRAASNVTVDTKGVAQGDGSRVWDLSVALPGDHARVVETLDPKGAWWAPSFSGATYASKLSEASDLLGVFEVGSALSLRGVVSPMDGLTKTNVAHNGPAVILQFPLKEGAAWTTTSNVQGLSGGIATFYTEQYASQVDAHGAIKTPFGTFDVLRVRTTLTRTVGAIPTVTRSFTFVTECYGTVATITSQPNEVAAEFTQASELSRLAP
jgi:hypothetical protein